MEQKRELTLDEMDKVSGGKKDIFDSDGKCHACRQQLDRLDNGNYWCNNPRCWEYHKEKSLMVIC